MPIPFLWERLTCNDEAASVLARELKISPAIARLLAIRGIDDLESARRFLRPSLDHLHDPFKLADMGLLDVVYGLRGLARRRGLAG